MTQTTIYHNPRCSKSRQTLDLIKAKGIEPRIVEYLNAPPDAKTLKSILKKLGLKPIDLMRTKESEFKALGLDQKRTDDDALIDAMVKHPILIERPIVIHGDKAALGRPPENVESIL